MFFDKFQTIPYETDGHKNAITDITQAFVLTHYDAQKTFIMMRYVVKDGETPFTISLDKYKSINYYWLIMFINDVIDPYTDWLMTFDEVEEYTRRKYGNTTDIHHFVDLGIDRWCDDVSDQYFRTFEPGTYPSEIKPVTNLDHELDENEKKREILLINPAYVDHFVETFNEIMEERE